MAYERSDLCFGFSSFVLGCSHLGHGSMVHKNIKYLWRSSMVIRDLVPSTEHGVKIRLNSDSAPILVSELISLTPGCENTHVSRINVRIYLIYPLHEHGKRASASISLVDRLSCHSPIRSLLPYSSLLPFGDLS